VNQFPHLVEGRFSVTSPSTWDYNQPCESGDLEQGFEKLVIYAGTGMVPTHMARQLSSGTWTSKLGRDVDIEHDTPLEVEGALYGSVVKFLKRPR